MIFNAVVFVICVSLVSSETPTIQDAKDEVKVSTEDIPVKVDATENALVDEPLTNNAPADVLDVDYDNDVDDIELSDLMEAEEIHDMLSDLDEAPRIVKDAWFRWGRRRFGDAFPRHKKSNSGKAHPKQHSNPHHGHHHQPHHKTNDEAPRIVNDAWFRRRRRTRRRRAWSVHV